MGGWLFLFLACGLVSLVLGLSDYHRYRRHHAPTVGLYVAVWFLGAAANLAAAVAVFVFS
jgi:hypothetical protein